MVSTKWLRVAASAAALVTTGFAGGLIGVQSASAATPKVVVTPSTNLHNGETVHVTGSGFKPGDTVFIVECLVKAKGSNGCKVPTTSLPPSATITSTGKLPRVSFKVSTGKIGNGKCGTTKLNLKACAVSVGNASGGDTGVGVIAFKAP
jgi:Neocarzinostatin family